jgi:hypothetical protein
MAMPEVRTFKILVALEDGTVATCAGIEHEGAVWLVPKWLSFPTEKYAMPERMIRLDQFRYQTFDPPVAGSGPTAGAHFAINDPLPKGLFDDELSSQLKERYDVLERPDLRFRIGETLH